MEPRRLLRVCDEDEIHGERLQRQYGFTQLPTVDILELLPELDVRIDTYSFLDGTSSIPDIALLKGLAQQFDRCTYLEIGSFRGESLANVAEAAKKCYAVTLGAQEMRELGLPEGHIRLHGVFSKGLPNVSVFEHNSLTFDYSLLNDKCDLIFVDGDHHYASVQQDSANVVRLLKNESSVIVWHDYGYSAESVRHGVLAGILDGLPREYHPHLYHVSNTMCAIYCRRAFQSTKLWAFPEMPNKCFSVAVTGRPLPRLGSSSATTARCKSA
jgi:hypothetical protein